ncbi:hypothetical protein [Paractinoplanes rishiriensis]|uniref:Uncharacterized protein n=1 Tax=Paractinoplanes rishiriensis TaxID=1050105 RepID=A0A919JZ46_9ACTN|nr:hypothetical protein [Actinoplanes rishiriensis]GIE95952.1 hypothetical protein Ari01nite_34170 [Actinoplanes rishiriensis]
MPVLLLFVLAGVVGCAANSWIAFALTVLGVPAALVMLGSLAERSRPSSSPYLADKYDLSGGRVGRRVRAGGARLSGRPLVRPVVPRMSRAERRAVRERAALAERKRHAGEVERLAVEFGLPNPTYEKFVAEEQARLRKIREALED